MRPRPLDVCLAGLAGAAVILAVYGGARGALDERPGGPQGLQAVAGRPHGALLEASRGLRAGIDPYNPPGLPLGVRVDPATGLLVGLDLRADSDVRTPDWLELAAGNQANAVADLPAPVRALDGQRVVMAGFMMALYALRDVREFALVGSHTKCCFGVPPGIGDQVVVNLPARGPGRELTLAPVRVEGVFHIRPQHLYAAGKGPLIWLYEIEDATVVAYDG